jgi:hypothetical protein
MVVGRPCHAEIYLPSDAEEALMVLVHHVDCPPGPSPNFDLFFGKLQSRHSAHPTGWISM